MKLPGIWRFQPLRIPSALMSTSGGAALAAGRYKMAVWIFVGSGGAGAGRRCILPADGEKNSAKTLGGVEARQSSRPLRRSSGLARGAQSYNRRKAKRRKENMKAFGGLARFASWADGDAAGLMMRRMQTAPAMDWVSDKALRCKATGLGVCT